MLASITLSKQKLAIFYFLHKMKKKIQRSSWCVTYCLTQNDDHTTIQREQFDQNFRHHDLTPNLENSVCCLWNSSWRIRWYHVCELFCKITDVQFIPNSRFKGCCDLLLSQEVPVKDLLIERHWSAIKQIICCQWQNVTNNYSSEIG